MVQSCLQNFCMFLILYSLSFVDPLNVEIFFIIVLAVVPVIIFEIVAAKEMVMLS